MTFAPASDSSSALHMTKKGGPGNMERIEIRLLVLQQRLEQKRLEFEKIHTDDNETDMLTKPMTAVQEQVPAAARFRAVRREFHQARGGFAGGQPAARAVALTRGGRRPRPTGAAAGRNPAVSDVAPALSSSPNLSSLCL
ncbi:unnamed protein product, partial [Prorocentrum cordatum]